MRISILPPFFVVDLDAETGTDFINATGWFMTCIHRYHRCLDSRWICLGLAVATWMADPCWPLPSGSPDWQVVVRHIMCVYILMICVMSYLMKPMKEYLCRNSRLLMSFFWSMKIACIISWLQVDVTGFQHMCFCSHRKSLQFWWCGSSSCKSLEDSVCSD